MYMGKAILRRPPPTIRALILDDHALTREGLSAVLGGMQGIRVVGAAENLAAALPLVTRHQPHVVLVHHSSPDLDLNAILKELSRSSSRVLIVAVHARGPDASDAIRAGAAGYLLTAAHPSELESAIRAVARGETVLGPRLAQQVTTAARDAAKSASAVGGLTARQRDVLRLIAEGKGSKAIAAALGIGIRTVETHRANLRERLNIHDVAGLVRFALAQGIVATRGAPTFGESLGARS